MFQAVLSNAQHPEYGAVTIPFPIPNKGYDHYIELLRAMEIGDPTQRDCQVDELHSDFPILKRIEKAAINVDELDYLAKRLDSFTDQEMAQFQGTAVKFNIYDMTDLINLTYSCQQATVITDFSDLEQVGRDHYLTMKGGSAPKDELERINGRELAMALINYEEGTVTPFGVVYDNGMQMERLYDGRHLPGYHYNEDMLAVGISSREEPENTAKITWLYLPCTRLQVERGMQRSGIADPDGMRFWYEDSSLPSEVEDVLEFKQESIHELNALAHAVKQLSMEDRKKLGAAVIMTEPEYAFQIRHLAENLDQFEFAPDVRTPAEYGRYMIQESGHFEFDPNLEKFYDYEKYGLQRIEQESGMFTDRGYISYHGTLSLDELMMEEPSEQGFQMGGMT